MDGIGELARMLGKGRSRGEGHARARVTRVEADGTVYAEVPNGAGEFPLTRVLAGASAGDWLEVEFRGGAAIAAGNATDPSAGASRVRTVELRTDAAVEAAARAADAANAAEVDARRAHDAADEAQESARTANTAANDALVQLATVEDVIGTVEWIAEHGTYEPTADVAVDDSKVYFTRSGSGTQADPYVYTAVPEPTDEDIASYYELHVDDALSQYVASHLALTDAGLYVLKDESGYKVLLSNDGMSVIDPNGHVVATYGESITFDSSRQQYIGNEDAYILFTPEHVEDGETVEASIIIGGANVMLGSSKTLSEWTADMQQAIDDSAQAVQTANDVPIVTLSSTNGTVFKRNLGVSTIIVATIFTPGGRIDNAAELHRRYGAGAYLEWGWRDVVTDAAHVIVSTDPRVGNGGFTLTVDPDDIDTQAVITCSLNY